MPRKIALLIGVSEYGNGIPSLSAPPNDVEAIRRVLEDPNLGGFDEVKPLINPDLQTMQKEIKWLFANRHTEDLLLLFFSGHGITDNNDHLYLTTCITAKDYFDATAVPASFVRGQSRDSRAKRQVMILDCCYSGAFANGWQAKSMDVVKGELGAKGKAVLTSSTATQTSFQQEGSTLSLYTQYLVEGIETGASDTDTNGEIYVRELHKYAKKKVQEVKPNQQPDIIILDGEGFDILLANAPKNPEVQYRQSVERYASDGKISTAGRLILQIKQQFFGIANDKAAEIENQVLEPFRQRLKNLERYREAFKEAVEEGYPLSQTARNEFRDLKELFGFRDEDVAPIEEEIVRKYVEPKNPEDIPSPPPVPGPKRPLPNILIAVIPLAAILGLVGYHVMQSRLRSEDIFQSQLFSQGEETFFPSKSYAKRKQGIDAFKKKDYINATKFLGDTLKDNPNDPESKIYLNNARALSKGNPVTLAVVVPLNQPNIAEEILRGVAQAQDSFNDSPKEKDRLLQIVIANDNNDPNQAKQVAQKLSQYSSIIGVIGHYTSAASEAALHEYETGNLATISPSSTKTDLKNKVFFRTLPNDEKNGETLANHALKKYKRVVIFNNPQDPYSSSLTQGFQRIFTSNSGEVVKTVTINLTAPVMKITQEEIQQLNAVVLFPNAQNIEIASALNIERIGIKNLPLLGADALYEKNILNAGNTVEGLVLAVPWFRDEPNSKTFAETAKDIWRGEISWRTATSYDATQAFIKALPLDEKPTRQTVLENLKSINIEANETSGNSLRFSQGERQGQEPVLVRVVRGSPGLKFELVTK